MNQNRDNQCNFFIGYSNFNFKRIIDLDFTVWYPSETEDTKKNFLKIFSLKCAENALKLEHKKFPLVIISHGSNGTKYDQLYLVEHLVARGYIVVTIQHKLFQKRISGMGDLLNRADEINFVISWLTDESLFKNMIEINDVSLIGFSAGGFASLMIAGAKPDFMQEQSFQEFSDVLIDVNFKLFFNYKIKKIILFAPALLNLFPIEELDKIHIPILLLVAADDEVVGDTPILFAKKTKILANFIILENAGHYCFNNAYPDFMKKIHPTFCLDKKTKRELLHPIINNAVLDFLNNNFKH